MSDEVKEVIRDTEKAMQAALDAMDNDFHQIRTGRASPALVEKIQVEYYGSHVHLQQLATVSVQEGHTLVIKPFDVTTIKAIEKGIQASDLKLTPTNDGKVVRLTIPPMTEERRREVVKVVHRRLEETRVSFRNARHEAIDMLKEYESEEMITEDDLKRGKQLVEDTIQKFGAKAEEMSGKKEKEVMEI